MTFYEPQTDAEWQDAVDAAKWMLLVEDLILYGLATGPRANVARCEEILEQGNARGIVPGDVDDIARKMLGLDA